MRILRIILPLLVIGAIFMPVPAHAWGEQVTTMVLVAGNESLLLVREALVIGVAYLADIMKSILALPLTTGDAAVYGVWKIIRDLLNMTFIVMLIFVAFGTIFKTLNIKALAPYYYTQALPGIIAAALLMNMSLPIGQVVVWAGNWATQKALVLMPQDGFTRTLQAWGVENNIAGKANKAIGTALVPWDQIPREQLTPQQQATIEAWGSAGDAEAIRVLTNCLRSNTKNVIDCYNDGVTAATPGYALYFEQKIGLLKEVASNPQKWMAEQSSFGKAFGNISSTFDIATGDVRGQFFKLLETAPSVIFMVMVLVTYVMIALMFLVRIPFIWGLLAMSSLAAYSFTPLGGKFPHFSFLTWMNNLIGWCLFGPVYIFFLYIGLFVASRQGDLIASMQTAGGNVPLFAGILASGAFAVLQFIIFMGGAKIAKDISFGSSAQAGKAFANIGKYTGIGEDMGASLLKSAGAGVLKKTGITPAAQAALERGKQAYTDTGASIRGAFPRVFRSEKESATLWQQRFGVRGGAEEYEKLSKKRIDDQKNLLDGRSKSQIQSLENMLSLARTPEERAAISERIKKTKDANKEQLRKQLNSSNRDAALAAAELLMDDDALNPNEYRAVQEKYAKISASALAGFIKRRDDALVKNAGKHKFKDVDEVVEMMSLIGDGKKREAYYKAAKGGKSKMLVLEAGSNATLKLEEGPNGKARTFEELAIRESRKIKKAEEWLGVEEYFEKRAAKRREAGEKGPEWDSFDEMGELNLGMQARYAQQFFSSEGRQLMTAGSKEDDGVDGKKSHQILRIQKMIDRLHDSDTAKKLRERFATEKRNTNTDDEPGQSARPGRENREGGDEKS